MRFEFLLILFQNQHFIIGVSNFFAIEWNIKATVTGLNFAWCLSALVQASSHVQILSINGFANDNCIWWDFAIACKFPNKFSHSQHFISSFRDFFTFVRNIRHLLVWNHFGRQYIVLMKCSSNINGMTVNITASTDRMFSWKRNILVNPLPSVT